MTTPDHDGVYRRRWEEDGIIHSRIMVVRDGRALDVRRFKSRPLAWFAALPGEWLWLHELDCGSARQDAVT